MKTHRLFLIIMALTMGVISSQAYADVVKTVGTTGSDYSTLKQAFDDINSGVLSTGVISLQLVDNTTETDSATLNASGSGSASYSSVKIYPTVTGLTISGTTGNLIVLNGASNVTIDGRLHTSAGVVQGTVRDLTIVNLSTSAPATSKTISLIANASNNTIQYCTLKGSGLSTGKGTISFLYPTVAGGSSNNTISNNLITGVNDAKRAVYSIYSKGAAGLLHTGNTVSNNEFKDFLCLTVASSGIYLDANNASWTISGNSFYETSSFTPGTGFSSIIIQILGGKGYTISDNYIGGSAPQCAGTAWTKSNTVTNVFTGISLNAGAGSPTSSVQNNTIQNILWSNSTNATWTGILIGSGDVNVGTVTGNTIGSSTGTSSIVVTNNSSTVGSVYALQITSAGTVNCSNNYLGAITAASASTNYGIAFYGITTTSAVTGTVTISGNTLNNISTSSTSTGYQQPLLGIFNNNGPGTIIIDNNTISNLSNNSTGTSGYVNGIKSTAGTNTITNNTVHDLTISNKNVTTTERNSISGIALSGASAKTVRGNVIYNLSNTHETFAGDICGLYYTGDAGPNTVSNNFIHSLSTVGTGSVGATLYGIKINTGSATYANNIVSVSGNNQNVLYGIAEGAALAAGNNNNFYHNTVYIAGIPTAGAYNSAALYSTSTANTRVVKNNIFMNARSNGEATGNHYAVYLSATGLTSDYNDYYVSGAGGTLGSIGNNVTSLGGMQAATSGDVNSKNTDPLFVNAGGTTDTSYVTKNTVSLPGVSGTGITDDYAGTIRTAFRMGAYETQYVQTPVFSGTGEWTETALWNTGSVPVSTASVIIDGTVTINSNVEVVDLTINTGKSLTVNAGKQLTVSGTLLTNNGTLNLKSDAIGAATILTPPTINGSGTTNVEQWLTVARQWWYLSSPLSGAKTTTFTPSNKIGSYDEASGLYLSPLATDVSLEVGKGYVVKLSDGADKAYTFTGGSLNTGEKPLTLTRTGIEHPKRGFNLIGNPYPSYLDWNAVYTDATNPPTNMRNAIWFRTMGASAMTFHTYGDGDAVPETTSPVIAPMQGFWVKVAADGSNGTLTFKNTHRKHFENGANQLKVKAVDVRPRLRLAVFNETATDETLIVGKSYASNELDAYDIEKMSNNNVAIPEIYTVVSSQELVINSMNELTEGKTITLGFRPGQAGTNFAIVATQLDNIDAKVMLLDKVAGTERELTLGSPYTFYATDSAATTDRFVITLKSKVLTGIENGTASGHLTVYANRNNRIQVIYNGEINLQTTVSVYNVAGQKLASQKLIKGTTELKGTYRPGVYMVQLTDGTRNEICKLIIN